MAVRKLEEIMEKVRGYVGEDTSDDTMSFLEDLTDTINSTSDVDIDGMRAEYEQKITDTENTWRQRYRDRFFGKTYGEEEIKAGDVELSQGESAINDEEKEVGKDYEELFE